jgi:hypothetical protein
MSAGERLRLAKGRQYEGSRKMQLSTAIATMAIVLGAIVVAGHAVGDDNPPQAPTQQTTQK